MNSRTKRLLASSAFATLTLAFPALARADEPLWNEDERPRLLLDNMIGGSFGLGGSFNAGPFSTSVTSSGARSLSLRLEADARVGDWLTLGGIVGGSTAHTPAQGVGHAYSIYALSIEPRVGALLPITRNFYLWPRVGAEIAYFDGGVSTPILGASFELALVVPVHRRRVRKDERRRVNRGVRRR